MQVPRKLLIIVLSGVAALVSVIYEKKQSSVIRLGPTLTNALRVTSDGPGHDDSVAPRVQRVAAKELEMKIKDSFTFAAVGDMDIRSPVGQLNDAGAGFQALVKVMRTADVTYANMEGVISHAKDPNYHKTVADDLKSMGVRVVTTANNHAFDGGNEGIFTTNRLLDKAGITHAGSGKDLAEAREAHYGITPKGMIGVVGMFSIDPGTQGIARESYAWDEWPGVNPLHVTPYNVVTAEQMASLRKIRDASYAHRSEVITPVAPVPPNESPNELFLFGIWYEVGKTTGSLTYKMDQGDLAGVMRSIRFGKEHSDFMIVAIHCHQNSFSYQAYSHDNSVPDFLKDLAHKAIDNGADIFIGHGVHTLRGVEIYKGKPIFYGLGDFFIHETPVTYVTDPYRRPSDNGESGAGQMVKTAGGRHYPDDNEVLLTTSRYESGKLVEVRLYPADLGIDGTRPMSKAGVPMMSSPDLAQRILKHVQELSKPFGTMISIEGNVGVIRVAQTGTKQSAADRGEVLAPFIVRARELFSEAITCMSLVGGRFIREIPG